MSFTFLKSIFKSYLIAGLFLCFFKTIAQNPPFDETKCHLIDNSPNRYNTNIFKSNIQQSNHDALKLRTTKTLATQSSTEVTSFLKGWGVDTWLVYKTDNNSITIETYPETVGTGSQSVTLREPVMNVIKPDGTYLVENYANHMPSNPTGNFYVIPADSPNGEYKIEIAVYLNDKGGYRLKCFSNDTYLSLLAYAPIPNYTETYSFKETADTEWTITQSEAFSVGNDVHEWTLPLLEGENLVIDLYNVTPFFNYWPDTPIWDSMDTVLYLLDENDNILIANDDGGNNQNARIYFTIPSDGNYKVIATNYGRFTEDNWTVDLSLQTEDWNIGTDGITYYDLKIESSSILSFTFEEIEINNPNAVKINAILLTNDQNLAELPVTTSQIETLITDLNTAYDELYASENWSGFELAGLTKFYNTDNATTSSPHNVLAQIGSSPAAKKNYINLIFTEIDGDQTGIVGTTYLYNNVTGPNGASIVLDDESGRSSVLIHEMGHVIGMNHIAGTWPPAKHSLSLQNGSMGYLTNYTSRAENSYMSNWSSSPLFYDPYFSIYLTSQPASLKTPSYGDLFSEGFRSWLITNQYIELDAASTNYEGNDSSSTISNNWANTEVINTDSNALFSSIASSKNAENNHAAYAYQDSGTSKLYYGFRQTDHSWTHNNFLTDNGRNSVEMNANGDAIIIIEPWYSNSLTAIYKAHGQNNWSSPQTISSAERYSLRSNFQINNNGDVAVVWLEINNNDDEIIKFNEMLNGTWVGESTISDSANKKELPSIAYNDNRDIAISWQDWDVNNSGRFDVVGAFRNGTTQSWGALETYSDSANHAGFSQVAINSSGDAIFYWRQATGDFVANEAKNSVGALKVRYRNYDGTLENIVNISPLGEDSFNASTELTAPRIVFEVENAAVTWWGVNENHNIIYAAVMVDKNTWNSTPLTTNGKSADLPSISMDSDGFTAVVWQRTDGLNQRIQSKFYNQLTNSWSSLMSLSASGSDAIHSDIAVDGNFSATASWTQWDNTNKRYLPVIKQYSPVEISLLGDNPLTLVAGSSYEEPGATAVNSSGKDVSENIIISGSIDSSTVGNYTITYEVTDSESNVITTLTRTVIITDALSINDIDEKSLFHFYPNPVQQVVTINSSERVEKIVIFNPLGQKVKTLRTEKNFIELDISDIEHGIYFMNITINSKIYVVKIIKD